MAIVFYYRFPDYLTGAARSVFNLISGVNTSGKAVYLITNYHNKFTDTLSVEGVNVYTSQILSWNPRKGVLKSIQTFFINPWVLLYYLYKIKKSTKINVLWVRNVLSAMVILPSSKIFGLPFIWDIGLEKQGRLMQRLRNYGASQAANIIMQYPSQKDDLFSEINDHSKFQPIVPGLSDDRMVEINNQTPVSSFAATLNVILVGIVCRRKNQMEAIHALKHLGDFSINLSFAGQILEEDYYNQLNEVIEQYKLHERVHFYEWVEDIPALLAQNHVLLITSQNEGLPHVLREGMLSSLAVISNHSGGMKDFNIHGETGYLYASGDLSNISSYLQCLFNNREKLAELRKNAKAKGKEFFNNEKWKETYLKVISNYE